MKAFCLSLAAVVAVFAAGAIADNGGGREGATGAADVLRVDRIQVGEGVGAITIQAGDEWSGITIDGGDGPDVMLKAFRSGDGVRLESGLSVAYDRVGSDAYLHGDDVFVGVARTNGRDNPSLQMIGADRESRSQRGQPMIVLTNDPAGVHVSNVPAQE